MMCQRFALLAACAVSSHALLAPSPRRHASLLRAAAAGEARVLEILGDGRIQLGREEEAELEALIANLPASTPSVETLRGDWRLLYTSKSAFDAANPLGRRVDGTAPGVEGAFDALFGGGGSGAAASSSPIQRFLTGLESVDIAQNIELSDDGATGRVDQLVEGGDGFRLRLSAAASLADSGRVDFAFDLAYITVLGLRLPYPVPFRLLGDEATGGAAKGCDVGRLQSPRLSVDAHPFRLSCGRAIISRSGLEASTFFFLRRRIALGAAQAKGFLETRYVGERLRVSRGNKGTTFILRRGPARRPRRAGGGEARAFEAAALAACETGDRSRILEAVERLERDAPAAPTLLDGGDAAGLQGRWSLVATVAGRADGEDGDLEATGVANVVNASGIVVDATADRYPVQEIRGGRIANEVRVDLPVLGPKWVRVSGAFSRGANGRRADVEFDALEVFDAGSANDGRRLFRATWPFALVKRLNPALTTGSDDTAWLETTYLSDAVRVGRGNKGSVFVLSRSDAPSPLAPPDF